MSLGLYPFKIKMTKYCFDIYIIFIAFNSVLTPKM